jgi:sigma-B regulation protein RsbU (phosphoserine phosphatase)
MTAVLVSTSVQSIRNRVRIENMRHEMITRELSSAREIQLAWLPERQGSKISFEVAAMNRPASHVSGDFYNWFELPDGRAAVIVGDVTGHGLPAAFLMATTQMLVRMIIERRADPGMTLRQLNRQLCSHVFGGQFVTMLVMVIDPARNVIEIANAGHPPPLVGNSGGFKPIDLKPQLVLAVDDDVDYETQRFELSGGSHLLLYTDGVTDVQSPSGDRLGIEGLSAGLQERYECPATLIAAAERAIDAFRSTREPDDDLTLVAVQLAGAATVPAIETATPSSTAAPMSAV